MKLPNLFRLTACSVLAIGLAVTFSSCQTTRTASQFPTPRSNWRTSIGQLQYATVRRSVIGEAEVSHQGAQDFQLDFTSGPGVPLMKLRESGGSARAEGIFVRGSWQGDPKHATGPLASWMALREAFAAIDTASSQAKMGHVTAQSPAGARHAWTAQADLRQPRRIRVQFPRTGERFVFVFSK